MQDKKMHKLGKTELLTIIYEQQKEIEKLKSNVEDLEKQLENRTINLKEAGSIAEASLKLNRIFEVAQEAADQYLSSIKAVKSNQDFQENAQNITKDERNENTCKKKKISTSPKDCKSLIPIPPTGLVLFRHKSYNKFLMCIKKLLFVCKTVFLFFMMHIIMFIKLLGAMLKKIGLPIVLFGKLIKTVFSRKSKKTIKPHKTKLKRKKLSSEGKKRRKYISKKVKRTENTDVPIRKKKAKRTENIDALLKEKNTFKVKKIDKKKYINRKPNKISISIKELEEELTRRKKTQRKLIFIRSFFFASLVVVAIAIISATSLFRVLQVSGSSMEPNLRNGELLITSKFFDYGKGDMIAFYYNDKVLIKRVIAMEGDTVYMEDDGTIYVNNEKLEESYVRELDYGKCNIKFPYIVPNGSVFILGDNRRTSLDSRSIGCILRNNIIGKIRFKLSPFTVY